MKNALLALWWLFLFSCDARRRPLETKVENHFQAAFPRVGYRFESLQPLDTILLRKYYREAATQELAEAELWHARQLHPPARTQPGTVYAAYVDRCLQYRYSGDSLARSADPLAWHSVRYRHTYYLTDTPGDGQPQASIVTVDRAGRIIGTAW